MPEQEEGDDDNKDGYDDCDDDGDDGSRGLCPPSSITGDFVRATHNKKEAQSGRNGDNTDEY